MAKISDARKRAISEYQAERKRFLAKLNRLRKKYPGRDYESFLSKPPTYREIKDISTQKLKTAVSDMKLFTAKYGHVFEVEKGVYAPRAFHEQYERSLKRVNRQRKERIKKSVLKELHPLKEPTGANPTTFAEFMYRTIKKASPEYAQEQERTYKENYIGALKNSYGDYELTQILEKMVGSMTGEEMLNAYYKPGNEDLGIKEIYPGEGQSEDETEQWVKNLIEKWGNAVPGSMERYAPDFKKLYIKKLEQTDYYDSEVKKKIKGYSSKKLLRAYLDDEIFMPEDYADKEKFLGDL